MASKIIKSNLEKEVFRYKPKINSGLIVIMIIFAILLFSIGVLEAFDNNPYIKLLQIIFTIGIIVCITCSTTCIQNAVDSEYQVEVEGNKLTYKQGNEKLEIILPCTIAIAYDGILSTKGFYERNEKVILDYMLEFDANDKDETGKTIKEFLEEANQRAMQVS